MSESILDRVEAFVMKQTDQVSQADVVAAFPGETANVVRLTLGALRKQGRLQADVEGGIPYYSAPAAPRPAEAPPLRQGSDRIPVFVKAPTPRPIVAAEPAAPSEPPQEPHRTSTQERLMAVMARKAEYTTIELCEATGLGRARVSDVLAELVRNGRIYAKGLTAARRYSLKPFGPLPAAAELPPAALEVARHTEERHEEEAEERQVPHVAATAKASGMNGTPRFAYWSDGSLELDCEACSGKLNRRDLEALRAFVAVLPPLAGD